MIQLDTGLLTRLAQKDHRDHTAVAELILDLHARKESLVLVPQNIFEFWTVATRPRTAAEGLGLSTAQVRQQVERFLVMFPLHFCDDQQLYAEWMRLVEQHNCQG